MKYTKAACGREKMKQDWLIYSESTDALFRIPYVIFSYEQKRPHSLLILILYYCITILYFCITFKFAQ